MKICSNVPGQKPRWLPGPYMVKPSKISFFGTKRLMTLKLDIMHRVLEYYQMMTLCWPWPFLWHGHICFLMLLQWWKLMQHIAMYFQACSAYHMHSGERYRSNGSLVCVWNNPLFNLCEKDMYAIVFFFFFCNYWLTFIKHLWEARFVPQVNAWYECKCFTADTIKKLNGIFGKVYLVLEIMRLHELLS